MQTTDGLTYMLKSPFDFSFLSQYGRVFRIFDGQDSGNICFGTEKDGRRYFIKFAGAPTARYDGKPEDAISRLKSTVPVYQDLRHPNLIEYLRVRRDRRRLCHDLCMGRRRVHGKNVSKIAAAVSADGYKNQNAGVSGHPVVP